MSHVVTLSSYAKSCIQVVVFFISALLTFIVGVVVFIIDVTCYQRLASWCGVDILQEIEEIYGGMVYKSCKELTLNL